MQELFVCRAQNSASIPSPLSVGPAQRFPEGHTSDYLVPGGSYHYFVDDRMSQAFVAPLIRSDGASCVNI